MTITKNLIVKLPGQPAVTLTAAGFCSPCEAAKLQAQTAAVQKSYHNDPGEPVTDASPNEVPWSGPIGYEREFTGDGRYIVGGGLRWESELMPLPLRWSETDMGGHKGAVVVGLIETLEVRGDGAVWGTGYIDVATEMGYKAYQGLKDGRLGGISMDLDEMSFEVRVRKEVYDAAVAEMNELLEALEGGEAPKAPETPEADEHGYVKVYEEKANDQVMYVTDALVRAATIVDIPAFKNAQITLDDINVKVAELAQDAELALVASAAPVAPPASWFEDPKLTGPTALVFTEDGRVFGHIAAWGTCHTGYQGQCVTPPFSNTNYAFFRTGALITDDNREVPVGRITMDTGHAGARLSMNAAAAHYDNTGTAVADVTAGEDSYGIWIAGALRPEVTPEKLRALRSSPMSGDWRTVGGNLELMGILAVNLPGFPVPRSNVLVAAGRPVTLINVMEPVVEEVEPELTAVQKFAIKAQQLRLRQWADKVGK